MKIISGPLEVQAISERVGAPVADLTALKAIPLDRRVDGQLFFVLADDTVWQFNSASALTGDDLLVATPGAGTGRFLRVPAAGKVEMPITFATADAAALLTMQAGQEFAVNDFFWRVSADWTGGTASAIGLSSNKTAPTNWTTKGDLLGGATGDVAATLVSSVGIVAGTVGVDMDTVAKRRGLILKATDTIRFDRITSAFTAGTGNAVMTGVLLKNDGA